MLRPPIATQNIVDLPAAGGAEMIVWLVIGSVIVALFMIINRTRKRSYREYMTRTQRQEELRANDPDMKKFEER